MLKRSLSVFALGLVGCGGAEHAQPRACGLAQAVATYDFVRAVRRADGSVWKATASAPFTRQPGPSGAFAVSDLAASGSSAYSDAIGCGIVDDGVWCFALAGPLSAATDLGAGAAGDAESLLPQRVVTGAGAGAAALAGATQLAGGMNGGGASFCAVTADGGIACWGYDENGLLGHGDAEHVGYARPVMADAATVFAHAAEVRVGFDSSCARKVDGSVWCWGSNEFAALGFEPTSAAISLLPVRVELPGPAKHLAASPGHTHCAVLEDTSVRCWGANSYGQAGAPDDQPTAPPTTVLTAKDGPALLDVQDLAPDQGMRAMCANTGRAMLWCWGHAFTGGPGGEPTGPYAAPADQSVGQAPLAAFGEREGSLVFIDGNGRLVLGAGSEPATEQPPCQ